MNERIKYLRKDVLKLSQKDFAEQLNLSENFVWMVEKGNRIPSDRTISDICRIFNINPDWLRNGVEPMLMPATDEEAEYITELLMGTDDPVVDVMKSILKVYMALSDQDKKKVREFVSKTKESRD